ncbi:hypothetical protein GW17_00051735 [Ensete ventricosum]|nr:hypothetical protein GW17_00051735 [Ensete ventricosum]
MESPAVPNREDQPEGEAPQRRTTEVHPDSSAVVPVRSWCHSRDSAQASPDFDTLSSDSTDSLREQVLHGVPDVHPSLAIQAFLMGLKASRSFWLLIERLPVTIPEMLQRAHQYIAVEARVAGKRDESKQPQAE